MDFLFPGLTGKDARRYVPRREVAGALGFRRLLTFSLPRSFPLRWDRRERGRISEGTEEARVVRPNGGRSRRAAPARCAVLH